VICWNVWLHDGIQTLQPLVPTRASKSGYLTCWQRDRGRHCRCYSIGMVTAFILTRQVVFDRSDRRVRNEAARFVSVSKLAEGCTPKESDDSFNSCISIGLFRFPRCRSRCVESSYLITIDKGFAFGSDIVFTKGPLPDFYHRMNSHDSAPAVNKRDSFSGARMADA